MSNVLAYFFNPEWTYRSLTSQLDTFVIEVSLVKALKLKGDYIGLNICHHKMGPMVTQWPNYSYLSMKAVVHLGRGGVGGGGGGGTRPPLEIASLQCIATIASKLNIFYSLQSS